MNDVDLTLVLAAWRRVASARQDLIDQLKAEKRQLAHEVRRLTGVINEGCLGCGDVMSDSHTCRRW